MALPGVDSGGDPRAALLGIVAGMRSQLPFALLALAANRGRFAAQAEWPLGLLRSRTALVGFGLTAIGEAIGDKLPGTPSRLAAAPFAGRVAFGGAAGAAVAREAGQSVVLGVGLGALGAVLGTETSYHARSYLGRVTPVPDPVWGAVEDALALGLGFFSLRPPASA